jgi:hypothetical protein
MFVVVQMLQHVPNGSESSSVGRPRVHATGALLGRPIVFAQCAGISWNKTDAFLCQPKVVKHLLRY